MMQAYCKGQHDLRLKKRTKNIFQAFLGHLLHSHGFQGGAKKKTLTNENVGRNKKRQYM